MTADPPVHATPVLSPRQREVLDCLRDFPGAHGGIHPTLRDIAESTAIPSRQQVHKIIKRLQTLGLVERRGREMRAFRVVDKMS